MPTTARASAKELILNLLERWRGTLDAPEQELYRDFVRVIIDRVRGPWLAQHAPRYILSALEEAFRFAMSRQPGEVKVEVRAGRAKGLITQVMMDDQPFIVDTCRLFFKRGDADYWGGFNLVYHAQRDDSGQITAFSSDTGPLEALAFFEAEGGTLLQDASAASQRLHEYLVLAQAMVRDFKRMKRCLERSRERCLELADRRPDRADAMRETADFLGWLLRDNFVFMGLDNDEPMGIQTVPGATFGVSDGPWPESHAPGTVHVRKSHIESPVHRAGRIDEILIDIGTPDDPSRLFVRGLFTYRAVTQPSRNVPILRKMLSDILSADATQAGSYRYKAIANIFDSLPSEFLFTASQANITRMIERVFDSEQRQDSDVTLLRTGPQSAFCLVSMPKAQYSDHLRRDVEKAIVERLFATYSDHGLFVGRFDSVLLHYYLTGVNFPDDAEVDALAGRIRALTTPWQSRLWRALEQRFGEQEADRLADTWSRAFPDIWVRKTPATRAVHDIEILERLSKGHAVLGDVYLDYRSELALRIYQLHDLYLTEILPVLDNFGFVVKESFATRVNPRGGELHLDTFRLLAPNGMTTQDVLDRAPLLVPATEAVLAAQVDNDALNRLVLLAGLSWQEVDVIRAYARYSRQLQLKLSDSRIEVLLTSNPKLCKSLVGLFLARFDPDQSEGRERQVAHAREAVDDQVRLLRGHDEDLLFSALRSLVLATVRTNAFRTDRHHHYLSFKFDCSQVPAMGSGRPLFEVYVHSREVEGVHLRFGKVARGGIRWSDRADYRREVLGLATTQQVKNVVIVPVGSKGGFYLRHPSSDRAELRKQADAHYQTLIRGLLDLTDNSVGGQVVPPPRVVRHDADDTYLVVAADKGTAHLSDTANRLSTSYGYWLDDAFASGGSHGYDHKRVGITARGAWVLVRRHFAERGIDPYTTPFSCVGVGDMGGDVFGNGLIESQHTRLLAAFNHMHVFLDPNPEPGPSYIERKRLFDLAGRGAGWDHYDPALISKGGGVYNRADKSIPLSPEVQQMLDIEATDAAPEDVIHAILKMDVDLFWNGGIGTYVKASVESQTDADDRSNNAVRIDASELRAKIIGEGGNLGLTPTARIEAGLRGVRLNSDAIDNSGGVDLSDHEVNIKILLNELVRDGMMDRDGRNSLLKEMTDEVATLVLQDNDAHGRQISRDIIRSQRDIFQFGRAIDFIERKMGRARSELYLPSEATLLERAETGQGLTRPELGTLSAWVKMFVFEQLMHTEPQAVPGYAKMLHSYFPTALQQRFPQAINDHMLAAEIAMTVATTRLVADAGAAYIPMIIETTGRSVQEIITAYFMAQNLARAGEMRATLEELVTSVTLQALNTAWVEVDAGARDVARYWLSARGRAPTEQELSAMSGAVDQLYELQAAEVAARNRDLVHELREAGLPEQVAVQVLKAQYLNLSLTVWSQAKRTGRPFPAVAVRHLAIGRASRLLPILSDLQQRPANGEWDPIALQIIYNHFFRLLRMLVSKTPSIDGADTVDALEPLLVEGPLQDVRAQVDAMLPDDAPAPIPALIVLEERMRAAISRMPAT